MMHDQKNDNVIAVFHSFGGGHKAIVQKTDDDKFTSLVYEWNEEETDDEGIPLWEKVTGPFILDNQSEAEKNAQENLEIFSFEVPDIAVDKSLTSFTAETLGHNDFRFFVPDNFEAVLLSDEEEQEATKITPTKVLHTGDFCFIENEDQWISGILEPKGQIKGWASFDSLKDALETTLK